MPRPSSLLSLCFSSELLLACGSTNTATTTPDSVTLIAIDPTDFPRMTTSTGSVVTSDAGSPDAALADGGTGHVAACGTPYGFGAYVAELLDVSGDLVKEAGPYVADAFPVQSSPAMPCHRTVAFGRVVPNRQYTAKVTVYADSDGDPSTLDICTLEGTSVTLARENGGCTTTLAKPVAALNCYGWQTEPLVTDVADASASEAGVMTGAGGSNAGLDENRCDPTTRGCPGLAIQYRTMTLHYCVEP
jgi:hypothetical protein